MKYLQFNLDNHSYTYKHIEHRKNGLRVYGSLRENLSGDLWIVNTLQSKLYDTIYMPAGKMMSIYNSLKL